MLSNSKTQMYRDIATKHYYELLSVLKTDRIIAKCLQPMNGKKASTIYRYLQMMSFRNDKSNLHFINSSRELLIRLKTMEINASVLFFAGEQIDMHSIIDKAKIVYKHGVNVITPQIIMNSTDEQFWDYVKMDALYADFIVTYKADHVDIALLNDYADGKEIIDIEDIEDIVDCAKFYTLQKRKFKF